MDHAMLSFLLLTADSPARARELARLLEQKNQSRRDVTRATLEAVRLEVEEQDDQPLLFAAAEHFHEGVLGLAAQRLCDEYYRPVIVAKTGQEESVSSARSVDEFDVAAALDECAALLKRHGGHSKAAGFTVSNENLLSLKARLTEIAAERLAGQDLSPTIYIDAEIPQGELRPEHFMLCQRLEPIGAGNPEPLFLSPGLAVRESRVVGDQHLKLTLADGGFVWDGIAFGMGDSLPDLASRIDVVFTPQVRIYRDKEQLQLRIEDWRPSA